MAQKLFSVDSVEAQKYGSTSSMSTSSGIMMSSHVKASEFERAEVIWCHERCYKTEQQDVREKLSEAASASGFALTCFKKAPTFAAWVNRTPPPPYVLLTDNREFKPCSYFLEEVPEHAQPILTIALVPEPKLFNKLAKFVAKTPRTPSARPVKVVQSEEEVYDILLQVSRGDLPSTACEEDMCFTPSDASSEYDHLTTTCPSPFMTRSVSNVSCITTEGSTLPSMPPTTLTGPLQRHAVGPSFSEVNSTVWGRSVATVFSAALPTQTAAQVEWMLQAARPERYED
mmetsp:Transcript_50235/g.106734  ORF Transcript_50235/g.106734 Transcript_50235/m.106734 type:complete len:286 (+) Transcript_50235:131-988(+)|eukprot:CAMPEP_0206465654 /NCGR_PEP_ID=MMETSP0324_2-20121206/27968_1 /ASSEMBLY_ACC=CAM_ASM_000836 /TAXON_ID=2866 /ORGANISM="Crypthecodinium cohnii, Strain Seligo" /LENGTH=285 /DNA_ID=CAMNT_0053938573 /DNA_START=126 /DNA_END=983 /DNA_ORIENTATION=+